MKAVFFFLFSLLVVLLLIGPILLLNLLETITKAMHRSWIAVVHPDKMEEMLKAEGRR